MLIYTFKSGYSHISRTWIRAHAPENIKDLFRMTWISRGIMTCIISNHRHQTLISTKSTEIWLITILFLLRQKGNTREILLLFGILLHNCTKDTNKTWVQINSELKACEDMTTCVGIYKNKWSSIFYSTRMFSLNSLNSINNPCFSPAFVQINPMLCWSTPLKVGIPHRDIYYSLWYSHISRTLAG